VAHSITVNVAVIGALAVVSFALALVTFRSRET
jgi:hypothetical protein